MWEVHAPRLQDLRARYEGAQRGSTAFNRWLVVGVAAQFTGVSGFSLGLNDHCQIGVYRNGSSTEEAGTGSTDTFTVGENPSTTVGALQVDGIAVEPFLRQISIGTKFELTEMMALVKMTDSQNAANNS